MSEIKSEKNITPCKMTIAVDPAKREVERTNNERDMLDFLTGQCQLTARIDGIDRDFLFGNVRLPLFARGCRHSPSCFGVIQVSEGLALIINNYSDIYLGFLTFFRSPGTVPGTLASRVG